MKIATRIETHLVNNGLWPEEASAVLNIIMERHPEMSGRWNDEMDGYPPQLMSALELSARGYAVEHLEKTAPMHFALHLLKP